MNNKELSLEEVFRLYKDRELVDKMKAFLLLCEINDMHVEYAVHRIAISIVDHYMLIIYVDETYLMRNLDPEFNMLDFNIDCKDINEDELFEVVLSRDFFKLLKFKEIVVKKNVME